jgi:general stress protein 26
MFTTIDAEGRLVSRPMTTQHTDAEGNLWFFTSSLTELWQDIAAQPQVNLSFAEPEDSVYVSISGTAERVVDRDRIRDMWSPAVQAWFPHGPDDPHAMLVRVVSHSAEYWDAGASSMVQLFNMAKAALTGTTPDEGQHARLDL